MATVIDVGAVTAHEAFALAQAFWRGGGVGALVMRHSLERKTNVELRAAVRNAIAASKRGGNYPDPRPTPALSSNDPAQWLHRIEALKRRDQLARQQRQRRMTRWGKVERR